MAKSTSKPETGSLLGTKVQTSNGRDKTRFLKQISGFRAEPEAFAQTDVAFPTVAQWLAMSSVKLGKRSSSRLIPYIDSKVKEFHDNAGDDWAQLWTLIDVYFGTNAWLKQDHGYVGKGRTKGVKKLFELTVAELCNRLQVPVNVLPREFERLMGRELTSHGFHLDRELDLAKYLTRSELRDCRVEFQGGRLMAWREFIDDGYERVQLPLNSSLYLPPQNVRKVGVFQNMPLYMEEPKPLLGLKGHAGFVMNMARELYMSQHYAGAFPVGRPRNVNIQGVKIKTWSGKDVRRPEKNFYHSSYLAGQPVMCSGTMLVKDGFITELSNFSGHYRPTQFHVFLCIQGLRMNGVNVDRVEKIFLTLANGVKLDLENANGQTPVQQLEDLIRSDSPQLRAEQARQAFTDHQNAFAAGQQGRQQANAPGANGKAAPAPAAKKCHMWNGPAGKSEDREICS